MLAEPLVELLDGVVTVFGRGVAIISYDKRELYAVRVKDIIIDNARNSIEFQSPEYINSNGDIVRDKQCIKMEKVEITLLQRDLYTLLCDRELYVYLPIMHTGRSNSINGELIKTFALIQKCCIMSYAVNITSRDCDIVVIAV